MSKICPNPNCPSHGEEQSDNEVFCSFCDTRLVPNPAMGFSLGDANAISGGVNINQSKNVTSHDTHYHSTTVHERAKSDTEIKLEATNKLRTKAKKIMEERGRIDSSALSQLRTMSIELGIEDLTFKNIIKDIRTSRNASSGGLSLANERYRLQAEEAVKNNDMESLQNLAPRLEAMASISQDDSVRYLHYLTLCICTPDKCIEVYENQTDEDYWRSFWAIVSYIRVGRYSEATKVLAQFSPNRYEKSDEDQILLEAYFNLMKNDKDGAQDFIDMLFGEVSGEIKPLLRAIESLMYKEETQTPEEQFYLEQVLISFEAIEPSKMGRRNRTSATETIDTNNLAISNTDASNERDNNSLDAQQIYDEAIKLTGKDRFDKLMKAAEMGLAKAQYDVAVALSEEGEQNNCKTNIYDAIRWLEKAAIQNLPAAHVRLGMIYLNLFENKVFNIVITRDYTKGEAELLAAAALDDKDAMIKLTMLYNGEFSKDDPKKPEDSFNWTLKCATIHHDDKIECSLGRMFAEGFGTSKNMNLASYWYRQSAEQGNGEAQNNLGECYFNGEGVSQNLAEGIRWYRKAAEQGNVYGQFNLGFCYSNGVGVEQDFVEAAKWYHRAAEQGNVGAQLNLGNCYSNGKGVSQDFAEAVKWYRKAAEQGNVHGQSYLGDSYRNGKGVSQDYAEAAKWYRIAAEQGDVHGQLNLGTCFYKGDGVRQDYTEAAKWYRMAAEQGDVHGQLNLGICYQYGRGVSQDFTEVVKWYRKAAEQGNVRAQLNLGNCYYDGEGVCQDFAQAVKWYREAAEQGNGEAQLNLGNCYYDGEGVCQDFTQAVKWYREAAEQGNGEALKNLGICYYNGTGVNINLTKAKELLTRAEELGIKDAEKIKIDLIATSESNLLNEANTLLGKNKFKDALNIYQELAYKGNARAQGYYGNCFLHAWGIKQDIYEGVAWLEKSANLGDAWSCLRLVEAHSGYIYNGKSLPVNLEKAKDFLSKAISFGASETEIEPFESLLSPSAEISNVKVVKDIKVNNSLGIKISFDMTVKGMVGRIVNFSAYCMLGCFGGLTRRPGNPNRLNKGGCIYAKIFNPPYMSTTWNSIEFSIPYTEITLGDVLDQSLILSVWDQTPNNRPIELAYKEIPFRCSINKHLLRSNDWNFYLIEQ